jgi:hypothetical protein
MAGEPRIIIGFHSYGQCPTQFALDLARSMRYCGTALPFALHEQSCYVDTARNRLVRSFLQSDGTHLLMMDVDIAFEPHYPILTFQIMQQIGADVLFGNYALGNSGNSIFGPPENISREAAVLVGLQPNHIYTDIGTGGTGWVMMTRPLLQRMEAECAGPWHWFPRDITSDGKDRRGEDVSFGLRLWEMKPRPKVAATTALVLRHLKNQPFIPEFMTGQASAIGVSALCFPNPYEHDKEKFIIHQNRVLERDKLTPEQIAEVEAELARAKEAENAVGRSDAQVQDGGAAQLQQEGAESKEQEASDSDHAQREAESPGREEGIPAQADQPKQE